MTCHITSISSYREALVTVFSLMDKGEENLNDEEARELSAIAIAIEKYENEVLQLIPHDKYPA